MPSPRLRSREHLLHVLAEAAELEHNLLCSYLYAAFSVKRRADEGLDPGELEAVVRWRKSILAVCMEEMAHLAQVANLMVALGSRPHFDRPNLPVPPGYHPAGIQVALRPFDRATLDHFIYLERPLDAPVDDASTFRPERRPPRRAETGVLMPSAPEYATIGEFYEGLGDGLAQLAATLGERRLFCGPVDCQLEAGEIGIDELSVVSDLASAERALHLIVVQGEGASTDDASSHYQQFLRIRHEFERLQGARPAFQPSRDVASNPVMRQPFVADRVHVASARAAPVLDIANAVYSLMLRFLVELYQTSSRQAEARKAMLGGATGLMHVLGELSDVLTTLPAGADDGPRAGVTFAMLRSTEGLAPGVDARVVLADRLADIALQLPGVGLPPDATSRIAAALAELGETLPRPSDGARAT